MADPITGAVVSGLVKVIFDKLGSPVFKEIGRSFGVKNELERISRTLSAINAVLRDAEEKQTTLHSVRDWLLNLKDVARDIEDVLDLISTQALESMVHKRNLAQRVREQLPQFSLAPKLKAICGRLEEISANRRDFNFQELQPPLPPRVDTYVGSDNHTFVRESSFLGRKDDLDWIVSRLVSSSSHENSEIPVIPIVGIGGMGKTTLAKLVYIDPRVGNFELKLWASLSNEFTQRVAIENIVMCATGESTFNLNMQALVNKLQSILWGQTFLLVLDNVWLENPKEWVDFKEMILVVGSKSSRIIVTARDDKVALIDGTIEAYKLQPLSDEDCWSVFVKYAFRDGKEKEFPSLVSIGKEIVRKCCGVPLAAKTLGSQLWNDRTESYWRMIEKSNLWKIKQAHDEILPALKLSFDQLNHISKACFSFCSTRITNGFFTRELMVDYWMALGLVEPTDEATGSRYFNELVSRSFFEELPSAYLALVINVAASNNDLDPTRISEYMDFIDSSRIREYLELFRMHDLLHELGSYVAGEETAFVSYDKHEVSTRVKNLVWTEEDLLEIEFPRQLLTANKARTFLFQTVKGGHMSTPFLHSLISNFRRLRILSLENFEFEYLPDSVGDSKHLRYLNLARNGKLKRLPDSVSKLVNLQTLMVSQCTQLELFPRKLQRLPSLRCLYCTTKLESFLEPSFHGWTSIQQIRISYSEQLKSLSEQIGTLITLRVLHIIDCPNLASLPNSMQHLLALGQIQIYNCEKLNLSGWEGLNGLRYLRSLAIINLPLLVHFPDGLKHCSSLLNLMFTSCENLRALQRDIQELNSLKVLWIGDFPILRSRCQREIGEDWNLISHIPIIQLL